MAFGKNTPRIKNRRKTIRMKAARKARFRKRRLRRSKGQSRY